LPEIARPTERPTKFAAGLLGILRTSLAGLNAEALTPEALRDKLPPLVSDLVEESEPELRGTDIVVEIVAHTHAGSCRCMKELR
jgi:hypothetical protein